MSRMRSWFIFVLSLLGATALAVVIVEGSDVFQHCTQEPSSTYRACVGRFVDENAEAIVALFTIVLAASTIALWWSTHQLWLSQEKSLHQTQRAIVALSKWTRHRSLARVGGKPTGYTFRANWENSGPTAALRCNSRVIAEMIRDSSPSSAFMPKAIAVGETNHTMAPRHGNQSGSDLVPLSDLELIQAKKARMFLLARIEYEDVFGRPHHTQTCSELEIQGTPNDLLDPPEKVEIFRYPILSGHNSSS